MPPRILFNVVSLVLRCCLDVVIRSLTESKSVGLGLLLEVVGGASDNRMTVMP